MQTNLPPSPRPKPRRRPLRALGTTLSVAVLLATLFTAWTPGSLLENDLSETLRQALEAQPPPAGPAPNISVTQAPLRIGIVAGHLGNDSGAVCRDASGAEVLTEQQVNYTIASLVRDDLNQRGFIVDLLQEFDTRLAGYRAVALISIHNDSCEYVNDQASGYKLSPAANTRDVNRAYRLTECMRDRYYRATGLSFHPGSITIDMTDYHAFDEIDPGTPAAIIETGFLYLDQALLVQRPEQVAAGIVQGILCFVNNENVSSGP